MISRVSYSADAGTFFVRDGKPDFAEHALRVPIVGRTYIGRAADKNEQAFCAGRYEPAEGPESEDSIIEDFTIFAEKPGFDGKKIIIPQDKATLNNWISRKHGELYLPREQGAIVCRYKHLSDMPTLTLIWFPERAVLEHVFEKDREVDLRFPEGRMSSRYLLLGGEKDGKSLEEIYPYHSFYVKVSRDNPSAD